LKSKFHKELNNKKKLDYIVILKNKIQVGILYGKIQEENSFSSYIHHFTIKTQKDYLLILEKLREMFVSFDMTILNNKKNQKLIKLLPKLDMDQFDYAISPNKEIWLYSFHR
jgi:hypothetical protein